MTHDISWLDAVVFDDKGLIPAIAQDADDGTILMVAWMNAQALQETATTGRAVYWSRSRGRLWRKGEESGHVQAVDEVRLDCDGDVILLKVRQQGGIACHTGRRSCFFRRLRSNDAGSDWETVDPVLKDPEHIYKRIKTPSTFSPAWPTRWKHGCLPMAATRMHPTQPACWRAGPTPS